VKITVRDSFDDDISKKFIIQFEKDYSAALAFKGINLQKTKTNFMRAYYFKNK
jgi:hypothetical protein